MKNKISGLCSAAFFSVGLTLSAHAADLTQEQIAMLSGPDREAVLIEGAKKEGEVVWYSTMAVDALTQPMEDAFVAKYPFLKISSVRSASAETLTRALAERDAKNVTVDVMAASVADALDGMNLTVSFDTPKFAELPKEAIPTDKSYVYFRNSWAIIGYNTNVIPAADAPKKWEDLLDPKFKGKLAWPDNASTGGPRVITHFRKMWGEEKALEFLKSLQTQGIRTVGGNAGSQMAQLVAGETPMLVGIAASLIGDDIAKGAPLGGVNPSPTITRASALALMKDAPHPYAAMLLIDFLLDKDTGQKILQQGSTVPIHPAVPAPESVAFADPVKLGLQQIYLSSQEEKDMLDESSRLFNSMFR